MPFIRKFLIVFSSIYFANGQLNCSYNPCGRNGYFRNHTNNQCSCECKFWWNGTLCDEQTTSGKQVIALGCLLGLLVGIVYGLAIVRCIKKRIAHRKENKKKPKEISHDPKLIDLVLKSVKQSVNLSSILIAGLTMSLAAAGLIAKWLLIQPIHNELVYKYRTNQSLYFVPHPFCKLTSIDEFSLITFPAACLLILILIISIKRTSFLPNFLHGYGGIPMPVDFLSHIDRKFAAFVFAVCADELLNIMQSTVNGSVKESDGIILTYLLRILDVIIMGIRYYVLLASVYLNTVFTLTFATLYAWLDYSISIITQGMCKPDFYPTYELYLKNSSNISTVFDYYGTGSKIIAILLLTDIPRFVCLAYVNIRIPMLLASKIYLKFKRNLSFEERMLMKLSREQRIFFRISDLNSVEMLYVRNLFCSGKKRPPSQSLRARLIPKIIYEWRDDYRFSTRVVCIYASILLLLYQVVIQLCVKILPQLTAIEDSFQLLFDTFSSMFFPQPENNDDESVSSSTSNFPVPNLIRAYIAAVFLTLTVIVIQLLILLVNIRRNSIQSYRGDDTEIPRRQRSNYVSYAVGNFHFAGYFIGYLIWGFVLIAVFSLIICIAIDGFITYGGVRLVEKTLKLIIPSLLFIVFKLYINELLAQYVFLQHHGEVLSLNNRRFLMIVIYFNFFLDAFLGFISSVVRLIESFFAGVLYMCRLDYSPLGRKLETIDGGFSAYCGFIHTECAHRHPIMLVCASHLYTQVKKRQFRMNMMNSHDLPANEKYEIKPKSESRYLRKWKLAVFLIRNPILVFFRKTYLNQLNLNEIRDINDVDHDNDQYNSKRRLSVYTRRKSIAQSSIVSDDYLKFFEMYRF